MIGIGLAGAADNTGRLVFPIVGWNVATTPILWLSVPAYLVGFAGIVLKSRQLTEAEDELANAKARAKTTEEAVRALSRTELNLLSAGLKHFSTERVSLFAPGPEGFVLVARWSSNPAFMNETRQRYPRGQGCLWAAWENGSAIEPDLPDPRTSLDEWLDAQERAWHIPRDTARSMTMRSRTYAAFRIDEEAPGRDPLGVLIFESQLVDGASGKAKLDPEELRAAIKGSEGHRLRVLLEEMGKLVSS